MATITTRSGKGSPLTNNEVDANFTNLNTDKAELSGATFTGEITANGGIALGDSDKATFGASDDLQIYHDGSASYIKENGTGDLIIQGSNTMRFQGSSGQELANFSTGGSVTLFNNGSSKLATTSTGIDVTGNVSADGLLVGDNQWIFAGYGADLKIGHDGTDNIIRAQNGSLNIDANGTAFRGYSPYTKHMDIASNGDISFYNSAGTTAKMVWDASAESLGIGTTNLTRKFRVVDATDASADFRTTDGTDRSFEIDVTSSASEVTIGTATSHALAIKTDDTEHMRIDSSGRVGIGVTPESTWDSGFNALQVGSRGALWSSTGASGTWFTRNAYYDGTNFKYIATDEASAYEQGADGSHRWSNASSGTADTNLTLSERMRIDPSGRVGIGTSSPDTKLTVADDTADQIKIGDTTDTNFWSLRAGTNFIVKDNDVERMRIDSSGRVGIGTSSVGSTLHLKDTRAILRLESESVGGTTFDIRNGASGGSEGGISFRDITNSATRMTIDSSGRVGIGTSSPSEKLEIAGVASATSTGIAIKNGSATRLRIFHNDIAGTSYISSHDVQAAQKLFIRSGNDLLLSGGGGTEHARITSSGRVGIGTSSPSYLLSLEQASPTLQLKTTNTSGTNTILFSDSASNFVGNIKYDHSVNSLSFATTSSGSERMRIDSSGNLLVGTTDTDPSNNNAGNTTDNGIALRADGSLAIARAFAPVAYLNRTGTDGPITHFHRDGTPVGSIGTASGTLVIGSTSGADSYMRFGSNAIVPSDVNGSVRDNAIDLGQSNSRFKDLYLSGKVASASNNFYQLNDGSFGTIIQSAGGIKFNTAGGNERARIDSSGNLLVGTTDTNPANDALGTGVAIGNGGWVAAARDGDTSGMFNRLTSDGNIVSFHKDGTTVGSIGVMHSNNMYFTGASGHGGLQFGTANVTPLIAGSESNGGVDLGASNLRFKDLYLSSGVYLGGTGAANKLDDYEEGTFTPVLSDSATGGNLSGYSVRNARYTKVGRMVTVVVNFINITTVGMTASNLVYLQGLPFSVVNVSLLNFVGSQTSTGITGAPNTITAGGNSNSIYTGINDVSDITSGTADYYVTLTYEAA